MGRWRGLAIAWPSLLLLLALGAAGCATAPGPEPDTGAQITATGALPFDPAVLRGRLSNGIEYYVKRNVEPRNRAALWLAVKAGSVREQDDQRGLAHFVEHMAFNGTERFEKNAIVDYLESIGTGFGPDVNAYTTFDETVYTLEIPTDDPQEIETALQILSDWAFSISFDPEEVDKERGVVLEEWRGGRGAAARMRDKQLPVLVGPSRYAERVPIGDPEILRTAPRQRLVDFYEAWYQPDLMAVIAVGDFDAAQMQAAVQRHFAPPPEGEAAQRRAQPPAQPTVAPTYSVPDHDQPRVAVVTDPEASATRVSLYRKIPLDRGQDRAAYRRLLVNGLFSGMFNARLFERRQVADPPYIEAGAGRSALLGDRAALTIGGRVDSNGVARGLTTLLEEVERVVRYGFTATELEREKQSMLRRTERMYEQRDQRPTRQLAAEYLRHFLEDETVPGVEVEYELQLEIIPDITLDEVNAIAAPWRETHQNTVLLVSGPDEIDASPAAEQQLRQLLASTDQLEVEPYVDRASDAPLLAQIPQPGRIESERQLVSIDATQWTLSNGITVIAKQTDFQNDEILLNALSPGGNSLVSDADYIPALTATAIATGSGVGEHDRVALDKLLAGKTVSLSPYIGELFEGFRGSASPRDLETLFQLVTLYATAPRADEVFFSSYQSRLRSSVANRLAQPQAVFSDTLQTIMAQNHFRARPLTLELLEELDLERAAAVYRDRFADLGDFTFVVVGAFDWDRLRVLTETYLASLPSTAREESWRDLGIDPPQRLVDRTVRKGLEQASQTTMVFTGDLEWSRERALAINAMGEVLQIRLREQVREELGATYSIGVSARAQLLPDAEYEVWIGFGSDPARADELLQAVLEQVQWLRSGGEDSYLVKVKEMLRSSRDEQLRSNGFWTAEIAGAVQRGEPFEVITAFDQRLAALSTADVVTAAQRYLTPDRYIRVVLVPEAQTGE